MPSDDPVDDSSKPRILIEVTYYGLHSLLAGYETAHGPEHAQELLEPRRPIFKNIQQPFGEPSAESRKMVESGKVVLRDGTALIVEPEHKPLVFGISAKFKIDEVEALTLFRSFLFNESLPEEVQKASGDAFVQQVIEVFTPFYYSELRCVARVVALLFRAYDDDKVWFHEAALSIIPDVAPAGETYARNVITAYLDKTRSPLPEDISRDPKLTAKWTKENLKDQLALLELLFWAMWNYVPRTGPMVVSIYEAGYNTNLGSDQQTGALILDEESSRLQQDCAAVWILIMIEVLELENFNEQGDIEISENPKSKDTYTASPQSVRRIHELVTSHGDGHFAPIYLAWALVLSHVEGAASRLDQCPSSYQALFKYLDSESSRPYSKERKHVSEAMLQRCLDPVVGLFSLLLSLLTATPLFVTSIAWKTGSDVSEPNAVAFRSVVKGLLIALSQRVPVELVPDYDTLVEVWVSLFGRSESQTVLGLCQQFWEYDFQVSSGRRAILDVARVRFPVQFRPLIRLLRALSGTGFMNTDPLSDVDHNRQLDPQVAEGQRICVGYVSYFFDQLSTFTQVIPVSACSGAHALYEKVPERYGTSSASMGLTYVNVRPIKLPGGSILPPKSTGRLLSQDGEECIIVAWQHVHSGWKLLGEVLLHYVKSRHLVPSSTMPSVYASANYRRISPLQPVTLQLADIGIESGQDGDTAMVADALDLLRCVVIDKDGQAIEVLDSIEGEAGDADMAIDGSFNVVQLTMLILEDALSSVKRSSPQTQLITSAMSLLSSMLTIPKHAVRVWLFLRSSSVLFNASRTSASTSTVLANERNTGSYAVTWALLDLVQKLFTEASTSLLSITSSKARLQEVKEEVLLRALRFVHSEIWMEHMGWKYAQLSHRFEVSRMMSTLYGTILEHAPPTGDGPLSAISQAVFEALVTKATTSSIGPLLTSVTTSGSVLRRIQASRQFNDLKGLYFALRSHLHVIRLCLTYKQRLYASAGQCLLEQALCARNGGFGTSFSASRSQGDPLDALAGLVHHRHRDPLVSLEAVRVLHALCSSLSSSQPSPPTIVGHLSDPEAIVASFVKIASHPYQDLSVRLAVWRFMTLAVEKEPALGNLFITGHFRVSHIGLLDKTTADPKTEAEKDAQTSALQAARQMLETWEAYWHANPVLLATFLGFLVATWRHGLEHKAQISPVRDDADFWKRIAEIVQQDLPPVPDYRSTGMAEVDGVERSSFHESVSMHANHILVKAHAVRLIAMDIEMHPAFEGAQSKKKPASYTSIEQIFKSQDELNDHINDAISNSYDPTLYDEFSERVKEKMPTLALPQLDSRDLPAERELGDTFAFDASLLQLRVEPFATDADSTLAADTMHNLYSINLNLSLAHVQMELGESWQFLLSKVAPFLQGNASFRPIILSLASTISDTIAAERRPGDLMSAIHGVALSVLLACLELAWFSSTDSEAEIKSFISLVDNVHKIILSEAQPPLRSIRSSSSTPVHQTLLQIIYFCSRHARNLAVRPKTLDADRRLTISAMVDATLVFVIEALRFVFDAARSRLDVDLDLDMKLLVAVFEQCTRTDINPSTTLWLTKCQESDVLRSSLDLFAQTDLTGLSTLPLVRTRKQPLYAPHILTFHVAFASLSTPAERLASDGVLIAYSNNSISSAISSGAVEVTTPELPGDRNPAHVAYCVMLSVVAGVLTALGSQNHFFDAEASGFVQLYGNQISRALSWTVGDPLSMAFVEEMERVVGLFYAIASTAPSVSNRNPATEKILTAFSSNVLLLLQQLNYALTHPNHLASLIEPVTVEERTALEKDSQDTSDRALADVVDPVRKPFLAQLMHRLFGLTGNIVCTLIAASGADAVLRGETEDLPSRVALVVPHSKVVPGEPASLGTLLELANCTLDVLSRLASRPAGQALTPSAPLTRASERPLDVREAARTLRRTLEAVLFYATTQLGAWLAKPEIADARSESAAGAGAGDAEMEDAPRERAMRRQSVTLSERLRRGMSGEMAGELKALLEKARGVLEKSVGAGAATGGGKDVDVTRVLVNFLNERVVGST
ncbi:hypothetical protein DENSPDRAFT_811950 [Dentipellis sp. KUC8613]|nr:hypothetical protein DENSPDRAFT_811950 [Dentipellis sp. KUC8613]